MKRSMKKCDCGQRFEDGEEHDIEVLGCKVKIFTHTKCVSCFTEYLNQHSTTCAVCGLPIFPTTPVGCGADGKGYAHLEGGRYDCATAASFCGRWSEGELIPHPAKVDR